MHAFYTASAANSTKQKHKIQFLNENGHIVFIVVILIGFLHNKFCSKIDVYFVSQITPPPQGVYNNMDLIK